jgi:hypothetical protein
MPVLAIEPSRDFLSPKLSGQLEAMVRIANAVRSVLEKTDFSDEDPGQKFTWISAVEVLAKCAAAQVPQFNSVSDLPNFWISFLASQPVQNLPTRYQQFLADVRNQSLAAKQATAESLLDQANKAGLKRIKALLKSKGIAQEPPSSAVKVDLVYDSLGKEFCAAASPYSESIRWAFQPKLEHCLYGLICVEYVFAHEYLSHLVPKNHAIDISFKEQWLVVALNQAVVKAKSESVWERHLWAFYRERLKDHVDREVHKSDPDALKSSSFGDLLAKDTAVVLYLMHPKTFWNLTGEMMGNGEDEELAEAASEIMEQLDLENALLDTNKVYSINDLLDIIRRQ